MDSFLTPNAPVIAELRLAAALLRAHHTAAAQGHVAPYPVVGHGVQGLGVRLEHDLLAREAPVGLPEAALVGAQPAAVAEGAPQDVLRAHAAVGGVAEQVRVVPAVLALAEDVPAVQLPARPLQAAPQGDAHGQQHRAERPQHQVPVRQQARGGLRPLLAFHRLTGAIPKETDAGGALRAPVPARPPPPPGFQAAPEEGDAHLPPPSAARPQRRSPVLQAPRTGPPRGRRPRGHAPPRPRLAARGLPSPRRARAARWRTWAASP